MSTRLAFLDGDAARGLFWSHAAAFGATWGVLEVTLGSFLHTLRLPFAGYVLAGIGAVVLVGERQIFARPGISVAIGIIAALCKTASPGGFVLAPMIGIVSEGILVELVFMLLPRNVLAAALAGAACVISPAVQLVCAHYILFGRTAIELYVMLLEKVGGWVGISGGWGLVAIFFALLGVVGMWAGLIGHVLGQRVRLKMAPLVQGEKP